MKFKKIMCAVLLLVVIIMPQIASAHEPYSGYVYNHWNEAVPSPNAFLPNRVITGLSLGIGSLREPQEIFVDNNNMIYILDTGNNRIIVLDDRYALIRVIDTFTHAGEEILLNNASGLFVTSNGTLYIADTGNGRILITNPNGIVQKILGRPVTDLISPDLEYAPRKILVDKANIIYVLAQGVNHGALTLDMNNTFMGFYGANRINETADVLYEMLWRRFLTREQIAQSRAFFAIEFANFAIDAEDFVYTATQHNNVLTGSLRKLNPLGNNILNDDVVYGDYVTLPEDLTQFNGITVDKDGFIYALARNSGRIFIYDQDGNHLAVFGAIGNMSGTFRTPVAIDTLGDQVLVLDSFKNNLTVFDPTPFGLAIKEAEIKYYDGLYAEAREPWERVLMMNSNYEHAYNGIGRALMLTGSYVEAMRHFRLGYNAEQYSRVKKEYRTHLAREHFSLIVFGLAFIIAGIVLILKREKWMHKITKKGGKTSVFD